METALDLVEAADFARMAPGGTEGWQALYRRFLARLHDNDVAAFVQPGFDLSRQLTKEELIRLAESVEQFAIIGAAAHIDLKNVPHESAPKTHHNGPIPARWATTAQGTPYADHLRGSVSSFQTATTALIANQSLAAPVIANATKLLAVAYAATVLADELDPPDAVTTGGPDLASAIREERSAYEQTWSLVEQAASCGRLHNEVEDEIRALNKLLGIARAELAYGKHDDVFDLLSLKVARLLPDVVRALVGDEVPAPRSIVLSSEDAPLVDQLDALADDLEGAASTLEALAVDTTRDDDPTSTEPYFHKALERTGPTAHRLHSTFQVIDERVRVLTATKTGRRVVTTLGTTVTAISTGVTAGMSVQATAGTAIVLSMMGNWIYARVRLRDPSLPARTDPPADE